MATIYTPTAPFPQKEYKAGTLPEGLEKYANGNRSKLQAKKSRVDETIPAHDKEAGKRQA